jgi:hypothetical protein
MKDFLEQGAAVSKDFLSKAGEKAQDWGGKGLAASKEFVNKAGVKAQDLGERGVLLYEIKQLETQAERLMAKLGNTVYKLLDEQASGPISLEDANIKPLMTALRAVKDSIEKREADLEKRKG